MRVHFFAPEGFERWDWRNYDSIGIGGSETAVCELAWRLAARGHEVEVYAPIADDCPREWRGTRWFPVFDADTHREAIWVLSRAPLYAEWRFRGEVWVQCQDEDYPGQWTEFACRHITRVMALCHAQARALESAHPALRGKVCVSSNAARVELMEQVEAEGVERKPNRCVWTSSPDRGLVDYLLPLWPQIREAAPQAELHVYYGFDNIDKVIAASGPIAEKTAALRDRAFAYFEEYVDQGVVWHGRVPQRELYRAFLQAAVWPYLTDFRETSCITCMEAQCGGAIPVIVPIWAVGENVRHGIAVTGASITDSLLQGSFIEYVGALLNAPSLAEQIRKPMMDEARRRCSWERVVDQWEAWMRGEEAPSPQACA